MTIQVYGSGCPTCKKLFEHTEQAVKELELNAKVEYIDDLEKMMALGIMSSPVLMVDNNILVAGQLLDVEKIKSLIKKEQDAEQTHSSCGCGCC